MQEGRRLLAAFLLACLCFVLHPYLNEATLQPWPTNPIETCPPLSHYVPKDVNDLAPQAIGGVLALGDSITAAFAALGRNGMSTLDEYRGLSYATGGDNNTLSLFNFINRFSPNVLGASTGKHLAELPGWSYYANDGFNAAQSNAKSNDLSFEVKHLLSVATGNVSLSAWKYLNLFIGTNDLCFNCHLPIYNLSTFYEKMQTVPYCKLIHEVPFQCKCIFDSDNATRSKMDVAATMMRQRLVKIANAVQARNDPLFTAVVLPFTNDFVILDAPIEIGSDLDCFHPSLIGHQQFAINIWNSLLTPVSQRGTVPQFGVTPKCPQQADRFFTR